MQRGRGGRDDFFGFGDPFAGFGGFGRPGGLVSNFFGGRDPFDDPFFTRPFGSLMGPSMFGPSMFGTGESLFGEPSNSGFLEQQAAPSKSKGPIIQELDPDDEEGGGGANMKEKKDNPIKHSRPSKAPYVENPDEEEKSNHVQIQYRNDLSRANTAEPQARTYSFQSKTVTYGGLNGAYYTSSTTRRTGGDGVTVEENKEADTTTRKATHRFSRGIRDKGHSVTRKLNSDGKVETLQTLHNLNEDELTGFEEAWKGNARQHLPGWNQSINISDNGNNRSGRRNEPPPAAAAGAGRAALPSTEQRPHELSGGRGRSQY